VIKIKKGNKRRLGKLFASEPRLHMGRCEVFGGQGFSTPWRPRISGYSKPIRRGLW